jgi:hypothetical protein
MSSQKQTKRFEQKVAKEAKGTGSGFQAGRFIRPSGAVDVPSKFKNGFRPPLLTSVQNPL